MEDYLGYRAGDADTPFGKYFQPEMAPLPRHVVEALEHGPQAGPTLLAFDDAAALDNEGYHQTENGYGVLDDGGIQVSVRTDMPGVTPAMWSWWFGWHGCDSRRYKLWHPRAHVSAQWQDGADDGRRGEARYVGRTSLITEYIGSSKLSASIQFVAPSTFGLPAADATVVPICAGWAPAMSQWMAGGSSTTSVRRMTVVRCGPGSGWADRMSSYATLRAWRAGSSDRSCGTSSMPQRITRAI